MGLPLTMWMTVFDPVSPSRPTSLSRLAEEGTPAAPAGADLFLTRTHQKPGHSSGLLRFLRLLRITSYTPVPVLFHTGDASRGRAVTRDDSGRRRELKPGPKHAGVLRLFLYNFQVDRALYRLSIHLTGRGFFASQNSMFSSMIPGRTRGGRATALCILN